MIFLKNYFVNTTANIDFIPIIHDVRYAIRDSGAKDGLVTVFVPGPSASVIAIEPIPELFDELKVVFDTFEGEGGQAADKKKEQVFLSPRVKAAMVGRSVSVPLKGGQLILEPYEEIYFIDFDKKAKRRDFYVQVMAEAEGQPVQAASKQPAQKKK